MTLRVLIPQKNDLLHLSLILVVFTLKLKLICLVNIKTNEDTCIDVLKNVIFVKKFSYFTIMSLHNYLGILRLKSFMSRHLGTATIWNYLRLNRHCSQKHKLLHETVTRKRSGQAPGPTVSWQANWRHTMGLLLFQTATDW